MFDESLLLGAGYKLVAQSRDGNYNIYGAEIKHDGVSLGGPRIFAGIKGAIRGLFEVYLYEPIVDYFYHGLSLCDKKVSKIDKLIGSKYNVKECDSLEKALKVANKMSAKALKDLETITSPDF